MLSAVSVWRPLVVVPRDADGAGDVVIARGEFQAGAGGLLSHGVAVELLPRGLVGGVGEATLGLQFGMPPRHFVVGDQDVGAALVEVDADLVAGLEDGEAAIGGGFGRSVEDRR